MGRAGGPVQERTAAIPAPGLEEPAAREEDRPPVARLGQVRARQGQHGRLAGREAARHRALGIVRPPSPLPPPRSLAIAGAHPLWGQEAACAGLERRVAPHTTPCTGARALRETEGGGQHAALLAPSTHFPGDALRVRARHASPSRHGCVSGRLLTPRSSPAAFALAWARRWCRVRAIWDIHGLIAFG